MVFYFFHFPMRYPGSGMILGHIIPERCHLSNFIKGSLAMVKGVSDGSTVAQNSADNLLCIYLFQGQIYSLIQEIVILPNISEAFFH